MSQRNVEPNRFVPSGVDAQSWIGFEHRIQERRFKALVATITTAIAERDGVAARIALEEARELRPASPELERLAARVAVLPIGAVATPASGYMSYRGLGAVAIFTVGVGLVIGIESLRPDVGESAPVAALAVEHAQPAASAPQPVVTESSAPTALPTVVTPTAAAVVEPTPVPIPVRVDVKREEPVGTAGEVHASSVDVARVSVPNRTTFRPADDPSPAAVGRPDREPPVQARREVPDDYVAASPRSESRPGYAEAAPVGAALAANVIPQPVSVIAPPPPPPVLPATNAATVTSSTVAPRGDQNRVKQVLNQYARAYGQLDPSAARAVWPTVDERALARAFASLESQDVNFDQCDIDVKGVLASASCRGTASYVGKIGSRQARTEARQWNFELRLHGDDWKIEKAQTLAAR